jgi:hypothetical protein
MRLTEQKMKVFGHDHLTQNDDAIAPTHNFQFSEKQIAPLRGCQQWPPPKTTTCDEVEISVSVITLQASGHRFRIMSGVDPEM